MGIYDRGYYNDDQWKGPAGQRAAIGTHSMVTIIIVINVAIFLLDMFTGQVVFSDGTKFDGLRLSFFMALKYGTAHIGAYGPFDNPLYVFELITYGFSHSSITAERGIFHILFNMIALFFLGRAVEQHYGSQEFIRFYLVAIVVSGLVWLIAHALTGRPAIAVGASGAVAAVVMLFVFNFPHRTVMMMGVFPMPAWILGVLLVGMDALNSLNPSSGIAVEAHLGGAAFAAAYFYGKWNFQWLKFDGLGKRLARKPNLRVHDPGQTSDSLSSEADRVLDKLHREGESSLSKRERKVLEKYSREVRDRRDT